MKKIKLNKYLLFLIIFISFYSNLFSQEQDIITLEEQTEEKSLETIEIHLLGGSNFFPKGSLIQLQKNYVQNIRILSLENKVQYRDIQQNSLLLPQPFYFEPEYYGTSSFIFDIWKYSQKKKNIFYGVSFHYSSLRKEEQNTSYSFINQKWEITPYTTNELFLSLFSPTFSTGFTFSIANPISFYTSLRIGPAFFHGNMHKSSNPLKENLNINTKIKNGTGWNSMMSIGIVFNITENFSIIAENSYSYYQLHSNKLPNSNLELFHFLMGISFEF
ncbi:MAG: hypothetical protein KatS3mg129_3156 [Leptospiraceae bacterium]|nr:MAG: hypothetical protein KatS3mg129_3156 [Leptospiraceae bacterium]